MFEIEPVDTATESEERLGPVAEYCDLVDSEEVPEDPPTPREMRVAEWRNPVRHFSTKIWVGREYGEIVAMGQTDYDLEQNLGNGSGRVHVHPEHRGRGLAREMAQPVFDDLEAAGRTRLDTWVTDDDPAETLVEGLGLAPVYGERRSRLRMAALDVDLMGSWVDRAQQRAEDYELRYYRSPIPDAILEPFCDLSDVMNTAPREDYEEDDEILTPSIWREIETAVLGSQSRLHHLIALHQPTGSFAGYTQIKTQDLQPDLAWQWNTAVQPAHRNKGLGRWLKAKMILMISDQYPEVTRVDTHNAGSNEPMLAINRAMGFEVVHTCHVWQGDLGVARQRLDRSLAGRVSGRASQQT